MKLRVGLLISTFSRTSNLSFNSLTRTTSINLNRIHPIYKSKNSTNLSFRSKVHSFSTSINKMAPRKRQPEPELTDSEEEGKPEISTSKKQQPPTKKQKQKPSSSTNDDEDSKATVSKKAPPHTEKAASKGKGAPGSHPNQSDYNPNRGKIPTITPLDQLRKSIEKHEKNRVDMEKKDGNVVYWMRMRDLRLEDNRALSHASELAEKRRKSGKGGNLIIIHILSSKDFKAHDTSSRKVDFLLRNLKDIKTQLKELSIPLIISTLEEEEDSKTSRSSIVERVIEITKDLGATSIFSNLEFEVNELWRDSKLLEILNQSGEEKKKDGLDFNLFEDTYIVPPGNVKTKENKYYSVFSPWNKNWINVIDQNMDLLEESSFPTSNDSKQLKSDSELQEYLSKNSSLLEIPDFVPGFECTDSEYMIKLWPSGSRSAFKVIENFFSTQNSISGLKNDFEASSDQQGVLEKDSKEKIDIKKTRIGKYGDGRNIMSCNGTSRLSPYLSSGVVSARHVLRETMKHTKKLNVGRDSGIAMFNTEISFRDFYGHVLAAWPRVCMGKCYITKYEDMIWNYSDSELEAWKEGKTGYPIVDASMRQLKHQGYMHNRGRMIVSMFLTKHLLHDWREGEQHFMKELIDCDFASNNGGWQWSASTGTDPQPYFRIFNPLAQSEKSDPDGEYIRHWVPELSKLKGKSIHAPFDRLDKKEFEKLGYPKPIVEHTFARKRALTRFKTPGTGGNGDEE